MAQMFEAFSSELALLVGLLCLVLMRLVSTDDDNTSIPIAAVTLLFSTVFGILSSEHSGAFPLIEQDGLATFARIAINVLCLLCLGLSLGRIGRWDQRAFATATLVMVLGGHLLVISKSGQVLFAGLLILGVSLSFLVPILQNRSSGWTTFTTGVSGACFLLIGFALLTGMSGSLEYADIVRNIKNKPIESLSYGIPGVVLCWMGLSWVTGLIPYLGRPGQIARSLPLWSIPLIALVPAVGGYCGVLRLLLKGLCFPASDLHWEPLWPVEASKFLALVGLIQTGLAAVASLRPRGMGHLMGLTLSCHFGVLLVLISPLQRSMVEATLYYLMILSTLLLGICACFGTESGEKDPEKVMRGSLPLTLATGVGILPLLIGVLKREFLHASPFFLVVGGATLLLAMLNGYALLKLWTDQPSAPLKQVPRRQIAAWAISTLAVVALTPTLLKGIHFLLSDFV